MGERALVRAARRHASRSLPGLPSEARVSFSAARLHYDEVRLLAPFHFTPADVRAAFDLIAAHALPLRATDHAQLSALADIVATFERLDAGEGIKAVDRAVTPETMRAAVLYDVDDVRIEERPVPQLGDGRDSRANDGQRYLQRRRDAVVHPAQGAAGARARAGGHRRARCGGESSFAVGDRVFVHHHAPCFDCRGLPSRRVRAVRDVARDQDRAGRDRRVLPRSPRESARHAAHSARTCRFPMRR